MSRRHGNAGFTLVELIVSIVIISIGLTGILLLMSSIVSRSADPMISQQAVAIGEAYLEEISARPFQGTVTHTTGNRDEIDHIDGYDGLTDSPPQDQFGINMPGVSDYTVQVSIDTSPTINTVSGNDARRIDITVSHPIGVSVQISGYRLNY